MTERQLQVSELRRSLLETNDYLANTQSTTTPQAAAPADALPQPPFPTPPPRAGLSTPAKPKPSPKLGPRLSPSTSTSNTIPPPSSRQSWYNQLDLDPLLIQPAVEFRERCRNGLETNTNGKCPGFLQCNLLVLRKADA